MGNEKRNLILTTSAVDLCSQCAEEHGITGDIIREPDPAQSCEQCGWSKPAARSFPEGITQCSTHDCKRKATGWLLDPEGSPIPSGHSCEPCAQMCIEEYEAKLGESWTFTPGYVYRASGNTVRSLEKMPDWQTT